MLEQIGTIREFTGLTAITVVFLVAAALLIARNRTVDLRARRAFLGITITLAFIALADWFMYLTNGIDPELRMVHVVLLAATFTVAPAIPIVISHIVFPGRYVRLVMGLLLVHAAFQLGNIVGGYVFWVDDANVYHRGVLYPVYMAMYTFSALYLVVASVRAGRVYQAVHIAVVFGILACMLTGVVIQVFLPDVRMTWPSVSMAVVLYFLFYSDMMLRNDALTKLLNRRSFEDALTRPPLPSMAVIIDIDDFKHVNDTHGHAYGDECLRRVAQGIRRTFGTAGLCYRTGGDEFAVIMTKRLDEVDAIAAELQRLGEVARAQDDRLPTVSVGYAAADADCTDFSAVFKAADEAMYAMKRTQK